MTAFSSPALCSSCSWSSSSQGLLLEHSMAFLMADVCSSKIFLFKISTIFSLDPGAWPPQQPAQPALGRHALPRCLRRQALGLQAADETHALLPCPFCLQVPGNCNLLHLLEGKTWLGSWYLSCAGVCTPYYGASGHLQHVFDLAHLHATIKLWRAASPTFLHGCWR